MAEPGTTTALDAANNPPLAEAGEQPAPTSPRDEPPDSPGRSSVSSRSSRSERRTSRGRRGDEDAEEAREQIRRIAAAHREKELRDVTFNSPEINDLWYATRIADLVSAREQNQAQGLVITEATRRIRDITPGIGTDANTNEGDNTRRDDRRTATPRDTREGHNPREGDTPHNTTTGEAHRNRRARERGPRQTIAAARSVGNNSVGGER